MRDLTGMIEMLYILIGMWVSEVYIFVEID